MLDNDKLSIKEMFLLGISLCCLTLAALLVRNVTGMVVRCNQWNR